MKKNKFAGVELSENRASKKIGYVVHYRGEALKYGSVYAGNLQNHNSSSLSQSTAFTAAEKWAESNGFTGAKIRDFWPKG